MTLIVLAISEDEKELTCISDSRISNPGASGSVLSDATAKVIPFTATVKFSAHKPKRQEIEWKYDLCFCFAGSTLLANSVFALGSSISRNIFSSKIRTKPSIEVIAEFFRFAFEEVGRDLNSRGQKFDAEIAVFGYDPTRKCVRAFLFCQDFDSERYEVSLIEYPKQNVFVVLGEKLAFQIEMGKQLERLKKTGQKISILQAFKSVHEDNDIRGVGGCVQTCFVDRNGIEIPVTLDLSDKSLKIFGISCDSKTNYQSEYTIGDISVGATIHSY